jgi:hypothetical protein
LKTQTKTAGALTALALAGLVAAGAQAATPAKKPAAKAARGGSCSNPWRVTYAHAKVTGDTHEVSLAVAIKGQRITVTWHAQKGYEFCNITLTEGRGQVFSSTNPSASYTYTDVTANHSNGIKALTATSRTAPKPAAKR